MSIETSSPSLNKIAGTSNRASEVAQVAFKRLHQVKRGKGGPKALTR